MLAHVPDEPAQQPLVQRLRAVIAAKDEQIAVLEAQIAALSRLEAASLSRLKATALSRLEAAAERERWLEPRVAELERRLGMDSSDSSSTHKPQLCCNDIKRLMPQGQPAQPGPLPSDAR